MASTHFYYNPTAGTGNAQITVSAATANTGHLDSSATITFTNGVSSCTVNLIHKFRPWMEQIGSTNIPATGGSLQVIVYTEYDIVFRSVPTWVTISSGNTTYTEGQRIPATTYGTTPAVFTLTAAPNTGTQRTFHYTGFNIAHYIGDTLVTGYPGEIAGTQAAAEGIATDVNEVVFDWNATSAQTFNVITFDSWTSSISDD